MKMWAETILALGLGALFVYAGAIKIANPGDLLVDIENYRLVSYPIAWVLALFLPPFEIACGLALCVPSWRTTAAPVLFGLMVFFLGALLSAWGRGLDIHCGCFGKSDPAQASNTGLLVLRDLAILGGLGAVWIFARKRNGGCAAAPKIVDMPNRQHDE